MDFLKRFLAAGLFVVCGVALAQDAARAGGGATEASVRSAVQARLKDDHAVAVGQVRRAPVPGLWEVQVGRDIVYTDDRADYLFVGKLVDFRTREDLTQARIDDLNRIDFKSLPLDLALKSVKGKGERVLVIFADPNCGFCKRFEQQSLTAVDNTTVYTFLLPILSDDSVVKSRQIWCSADRQKAWTALMLEGRKPIGKADCPVPLDKLGALGNRLGVTATPTLFFADGTRVAGAISADELEERFRRVGTP